MVDIIDIETLRENLTYEPETGIFRWGVKRRSTHPAGSVAGYINKRWNRLYIDLMGKNYIASRLAWYWMTGEWPDFEIDHIDCDKLNNRWNNLRKATKSQNGANRSVRSDSSVGLKGVKRCREKFQARIRVNGREIHLGTFDTPEAAHHAYSMAACRYFGEFARAA